jgi:hypothetical protein
MIDVEQTIISQYGTSPTISQLIRNMNENIDPRANFDEFFDYVWNINTAKGFGLDDWGKIVGISRDIQLIGTSVPFGFSQSVGCYPFNEGTFYTQGDTFVYTLADDSYRTLILTKAMSNISASTSRAFNQLLQNLFVGRGRAYVNDLGNMQMRYVFEFYLTAAEFAIISQGNAMPRPAGVGYYVMQIPTPHIFGFSQMSPSVAPFNQGVFLPEGSIYYAA